LVRRYGGVGRVSCGGPRGESRSLAVCSRTRRGHSGSGARMDPRGSARAPHDEGRRRVSLRGRTCDTRSVLRLRLRTTRAPSSSRETQVRDSLRWWLRSSTMAIATDPRSDRHERGSVGCSGSPRARARGSGYQPSVVAALEDVSGAFVRRIEPRAVRPVEPLHPVGQVRARRFEQQVIVGVHEAVGVAAPRVPAHRISQRGKEDLTIRGGRQHRASAVPAGRDVVEAFSGEDARWSCHLETVRRPTSQT
jgi:hypothetical protein